MTPARAAQNANNARALENGLLWVSLGPMLIKLVVYTGLYWTLPRDRARRKAQEDANADGSPNSGKFPRVKPTIALVEGAADNRIVKCQHG